LKTILNYAFEASNKKFSGSGATCVGGIFFLRYFCPSLISPVDNRIVELQPKSNSMRTLILLTKILQNISNGVKVTENQKEPFMMNVKDLIDETISSTQEFLKNLSSTFWIHEGEVMKPIKVNSQILFRTLQTFQKSFKEIGDFKTDNVNQALY
jgi:translation initiation factor 2B subunit (eIF-2B alpha/beta/delta family)